MGIVTTIRLEFPTDLERRIAILDTQIAKLSGSSSGYVTRFYTR